MVSREHYSSSLLPSPARKKPSEASQSLRSRKRSVERQLCRERKTLCGRHSRNLITQDKSNFISKYILLCRKKQSEQQNDRYGAKRSRITGVNKVIFVDSYILNYSTFYPGKLLGSTLSVGNTSNSEQIVELSIDSGSFQFSKAALKDKFGNPELPFSLDAQEQDSKKTTDTIVNSEIKHEAWYIENPISKELTKRITLKLGPKAE